MSAGDLENEFTARLAECERELYCYILTMIPSHADALDVLQEASVAMWQKYDDYQGTGPFRSWAFKFAHIQVLKYRERQRYRDWMLRPFDETTIAVLATAHDQYEGVLEIRREALEQCLKKLSPEQVALIETRYAGRGTLRELARASGQSEDRLHRLLKKVRTTLRICIDRTLTSEGAG